MILKLVMVNIKLGNTDIRWVDTNIKPKGMNLRWNEASFEYTKHITNCLKIILQRLSYLLYLIPTPDNHDFCWKEINYTNSYSAKFLDILDLLVKILDRSRFTK